MFRITNNNISITRGETATYDAVFKHSDGTPLTLDKNLVADDKSVYGLFSVKLSMYDEDAVFRVPMKLDDLATFDTSADIISIGDETFSNVNVPDVYSTFEATDKYRTFVANGQIQNIDIVYNPTTYGRFPFLCEETGNLFYFMNDDVPSGVTSGIYKWNGANWGYDATLTAALPGYFSSDVVGTVAHAVPWYFDGDTYISGYFVISNNTVYKTYKFDDSSLTPFVEVTFTGAPTELYADDLWDDGTNLYLRKYDWGTSGYKTCVLNDGAFVDVSINITANPKYIWKDTNGNVYYNDYDNHIIYKWNKNTTSWGQINSNKNIVATSLMAKPVIVNGKVYQGNNNVLVDTTNGLIWKTLDTPLNLQGTVWHNGDDWMCTYMNSVITNHNRIAKTAVDERADKLYKRTISGVPYYYQYVGNTTSVTEDDFEEYEFRLVFPFPYNIMKTLQPKLYKYEIALVGGTPTGTITGQEPVVTLPLTIDFKKYLVEFKDFKVEGSLSE